MGDYLKVKRICKTCGKEFFVYLWKIERGHGNFCSKECAYKARLGENHPLWKGGKIKTICPECKKEFYINPSALKHGRGKYCSKNCKVAAQSGETNHLRKKTKQVCEYCEKEFFVMPYVLRNGGGKYCSSDCYHKGTSGENNPFWKGGISFEPYCPKFNARRKKAVRDFFNNTCLACGKLASENIVGKKGAINLPVHHADHDKEQGCNGKPFNLVPLCNDCHVDELYNQEEYKQYINKTLEEGFKWGIWNREEYLEKVMYPDD